MGILARELAARFGRVRLTGWSSSGEERLFTNLLERRYGFEPRADVLLTGPGRRKVAVEFEVSRADPVANQVKFFAAHRAGCLGSDGALVSMFSPHIDRGARNLGALFARHLRADGLAAFNVSLLPHLSPEPPMPSMRGTKHMHRACR